MIKNADNLDNASELAMMEANAQEKMIRQKAAKIEKGLSGECIECGEFNQRLISGICSPCRDFRIKTGHR